MTHEDGTEEEHDDGTFGPGAAFSCAHGGWLNAVDTRMLAPMSARTRTILVWVLLVLGTVVVLVRVPDSVGEAAGARHRLVGQYELQELLQDDQVRSAISIYIVDELYSNLDPQATRGRAAPEPQGLAGPLAEALRHAVEAVDRVPSAASGPGSVGPREPRGA